MTLFAILICLFLQRYLGWGKTNQLIWLDSYAQTATSFWEKLGVKKPLILLVALLLPLMLIVAGISYLLCDVWFNILGFIFSVVVLFYCLHANNLKDQLANYFNAYDQGDQQAAFRYGSAFLGEETSHDAVTLYRTITQRIFVRADQYIFSVLFWYILAGSVGAATYALVVYFAASTKQQMEVSAVAQWLQTLLDWVPVRVTGFSYALAGHFAFAFSYWCKHVVTGLAKTREFAFGSGLAALELENSDAALADAEENRLALNLVDRTIVLWMVVLALFTLVAWVS